MFRLCHGSGAHGGGRRAGLSQASLASERVSVVLGTTMGEVDVISELESAWLHRGEQAVATNKLARYGTTLLPVTWRAP